MRAIGASASRRRVRSIVIVLRAASDRHRSPAWLIDTRPDCTDTVEFVLRHPQDPNVTAVLGHDPQRGGVYVETKWGDLLVTLDQAEMEVGRDSVFEVMALLVSFGFMGPDDIRTTREWFSRPSCWRRRRATRQVQRVLMIVRALEEAAG